MRITLFLGVLLGPAVAVLAQPVLYAIDRDSPYLSIVDPETGGELSSVLISVPGETALFGTGLAVNPQTGEMYAAMKLLSQTGSGRNLVRIDPATGAGVNIGNMGQPIASLAFSSAGVLYGVSGDCSNNCGGAATPETLFTVDTDDASLTLFMTLGNGEDGEAIAFNPDDGMMYHMSGFGSGLVFERINLTTRAITNITISPPLTDYPEATGFTWDASQGLFVGSLIDWVYDESAFGTITATGNVTNIGLTPYYWKDYAFAAAGPAPRFADVPFAYWAYDFIESLALSGITSGCGGGNYCPEDPVTRAQMAVFLERGIHGVGYTPPAATGTAFLDVPANAFAAAFIEQLAADGITSGCGGGNYCPGASVTRAQMAVFLLRAVHGAAYTPPAATGQFGDVPIGYWAASWIEQLAAEGITSGCGDGNYCPESSVTRSQMAVFLVRAFGL